MGVGGELQRIRGQLAVITGSSWNSPVSLSHLNPASADTGSTHVSGNVQADGQLISNEVTGTAPLSVASTTVCTNLNADAVDGIEANTTPTANNLLPLDANAHFPITAVEYDSTEAQTLDTLTAGTSNIENTLNRIRYQLGAISEAAGLGGTWNAMPSSLVTSLNAAGNPASGGPKYLAPGTGISVAELNGVLTIATTGAGVDTQGGVTYADVFPDAIITGLAVSAGTGLTVNMAPGTAYIGGGRSIALYAESLTVPASSTSYIWWNGAALQYTTTNSNPGGCILLASCVTSGTAVTSVSDLRFIFQQSSHGAQTAGASYSSTVQNMVQDCYNALRALKLIA